VGAFEAHVSSSYKEFTAPGMFSVLKRTSVRSSGITKKAVCGLCDKHMTLRALQKHLGHHQEQLSLFALPANVDETGDDEEEEKRDSLLEDEAIDEDDGQGTDTSDISEEDDASARKTRFCICNGVECGMMIECANKVRYSSKVHPAFTNDDQCVKQWFHADCVNFVRNSIHSFDRWYCPDCRTLHSMNALEDGASPSTLLDRARGDT